MSSQQIKVETKSSSPVDDITTLAPSPCTTKVTANHTNRTWNQTLEGPYFPLCYQYTGYIIMATQLAHGGTQGQQGNIPGSCCKSNGLVRCDGIQVSMTWHPWSGPRELEEDLLYTGVYLGP